MEHTLSKLVAAIERTYGNTWSLMWRNFLAGFTKALGATIGYALFVGVLYLVAQKLGLFETVQNFWNELMSQIPLNQSERLNTNPDLIEQLRKLKE